MFKSGYSLVENSIGTNALLFANKKGKPVWFYPKHHYCYNLKTISSFSVSQFSIALRTSRFLRMRIFSCFTTNLIGANPFFETLSFLISKLYLIVTNIKLGEPKGGRFWIKLY